MDRINFWYTHPNLDINLKKQMDTMSAQEKEDAFYTNITFGTAGMRGILGPGCNRMNIHTLRKANLGFAQYIVSCGPEAMARGIAIGYDNRHMSKEFAQDCAELLAMHNIPSYIFESLRPTPELSFAVRHFNCFGGIMITASHNPKEYNGYKLYDEQGCQLIPSLAKQVIDHVNAIEDELSISVSLTNQQTQLITVIGQEVDELYYEKVLGVQLQPTIKKEITIVFSPEHGTSAIVVPELYKRAGYQCFEVKSQSTPDPDFSHTKTPNPEEPAAYEEAIVLAKEKNADIILVCDPDADRMGVGVYHGGEYHLLTGNQSGALLMEYILSQRKAQGTLPANAIIFNTVVTGDLGERIANAYGVEVEKTLTGFKFIGEKIEKYTQTKEKEYVFGYEESYGSLISPFARDKDAPQACLVLAEAAAFYKQQGQTLVNVLENLYHQHGFYEESQFSVLLEGGQGAKKIKEILKNLREAPLQEIDEKNVIGWEDYETLQQCKNKTRTPLMGFTPSEVLKYYLEDGSWVAVRPSGTEPKCKFYFCVKGNTKIEALEKTKRMHQSIKEKLNL